jgi:peptide/nickel transport system substrate-binding protein
VKKLLSVLACCVLAFTLVACGNGNSSKGENDTLIVGTTRLNGVFSPLYYLSSYDGWVVNLVFDQLMQYNENNELEPLLIEDEPTISEDGLTYTFKLKEGIEFSNGEKLTAEDVKFTLSVLADPGYTGRWTSNVEYVKGYDAMREGEATELEGIQVIDDQTVEITFTEFREDNITNVALIGIVSEASYPDYELGNEKGLQDQNQTPIGTGPYVLNEWGGTDAVLVKNEKYWGEGYEIPRVIMKEVEMTTEFEELRNNSIDVLPGVIEPTKVGPTYTSDNLDFNAYTRAGMGYITYNTITGATEDVAVRQALTYAFDRQSFVDTFYETPEMPEGIGTYVPRTYQNPAARLGATVRGETEVEGLELYEYDLDKANKVLDDAGWVRGDDGVRVKNGQRLEIKVLAIEAHDILNMIIPMWTSDWTAIGADVQVALADFNTVMDKIGQEDSLDEWNVYFMATSWTNANNGGIYRRFHSSQIFNGGDNNPRINNPELDALLDAGMSEQDPERSIEIFQEAAVLINNLVPVVPIYANIYYDLYNADVVEDFNTNTFYQWPSALRDAKLK